MKNSPLLIALWLSPAAIACATHDDGQPAPEAKAATASDPLSLSKPKDGVQLRTQGRKIGAGADEEWCELAELPGSAEDTFFVGATELAMTPFSHHLIVSMAPDGSKSLTDKALADPTPCDGTHGYGTDLVTLAASAQPYLARTLPDGIGFVLHGGQRLVFDYHSLNTGAQPIHVLHALNLHFVDHIDKPARLFGFYNQYIEIPAHSVRSFSDECRFKDEIRVLSITRHTHRYGTDFNVLWAGGEHDGEPIWTSHDWERDIEYDFEQPVDMPAGTGFRWQCSFNNPTDATLQFGPQASDEMCILFGSFVAVGADADVGPQSCYHFAP